MGALETIRALIPEFEGYEDIQKRRIADELVRAFAGERFAELPAEIVDSFSPGERELYDRLLLRSEFLNQAAFRVFEEKPTPERINALLEADAELVTAAKELETAKSQNAGDILRRVNEALDGRDTAMIKP